jgi:uncharacterized repeat protein (TIGR01451 family)
MNTPKNQWKVCITIAIVFLAASVFPGPVVGEVSYNRPGGLSLGNQLFEKVDREAIIDKAVQEGQVSVIVGFNGPHFSLDQNGDPEVSDRIRQDGIAEITDAFLERMAAHEMKNIKRYEFLPYIAMTVDPAGVQALMNDPQVTSIEEVITVAPVLSQSTSLVRAHFAHTILYDGTGQTIAILDTGVDRFHANLAGKVVSEACYSTNDASKGFSSLCPGGATSSTATNSGLNCSSSINGCDHGTHVAGIAAGIAPDARLLSIQVFSRATTGCNTSPCTLADSSDILGGLNRVYALRNTFNIASVNMSLGSGQYSSSCDNVGSSLKSSIDLLRNVGITTVVAAGNSGYKNSMGWPACFSNVVSVGATTKSNQVADYSNVSTLTTLLAPGSDIYSPIPPTALATHASKNGTSMAAPHVAGAVAVLKEAKPNASAFEITNLLATSGVTVTDQRAGGFITKRLLDVWTALCQIITCDADDFRTIFVNQTLNGTINPASDVDHYYYFGVAGDRLTIRMNRISGSIDPYLELFSPNGFRVAFNDNGGGGVNALINGYFLPANGLYLIKARNVSPFTGNYQLSVSKEVVQLNPVQSISYLSPHSATGTFFGSDFWVAIYGQNFMPESQVRWNGLLRTKFYSSPSLIYIRVLGSDIGWPWPRNAFITVVNPTPGGGTSNSRVFTITDPFLGTFELDTPQPGSSVPAGVKIQFDASWTAPDEVETWRTMQNMDMILRDNENKVAAWIRVVERPGTTSTYRLLNSAGEPVTDENGEPNDGLPGEDRVLEIPGLIILHLNESEFSGSGLVATMKPVLTFGPEAVGVYNIEFQVDNEEGEIQAGDVLGSFTVLPEGCEVALDNVSIAGISEGRVNTSYTFTAVVEPQNPTPPVTYEWAPEPVSGQGTGMATYNWSEAGVYVVSLQISNCANFIGTIEEVQIATTTDPDLTLEKFSPAVAVVGDEVIYTLKVTNNGATKSTNLVVTDTLPAGATYVSGGVLLADQVEWQIDELVGYGSQVEVSYKVIATARLVNQNYSVVASGGYNAMGEVDVITDLVDAYIDLDPLTGGVLAYFGDTGLSVLATENARTSDIVIPAGSLFSDTRIAYTELPGPTRPIPDGTNFASRAFVLQGYQENQFIPELGLSEIIDFTIGYKETDIIGINEQLLKLHFWDGNRWSQEGVVCQPDEENNQVQCTIMTPPLTEYVLLETYNRVFIPLIVR